MNATSESPRLIEMVGMDRGSQLEAAAVQTEELGMGVMCSISRDGRICATLWLSDREARRVAA